MLTKAMRTGAAARSAGAARPRRGTTRSEYRSSCAARTRPRRPRRAGGDVVPAVHRDRSCSPRAPRTLPGHDPTEAVPGDLVDCGIGRGGAAVFLRGVPRALRAAGPRVWVVDRFRSTPDPETRAARFPREGVPGSRPTCTSCATRFDASTCSTSASASSRARSTPRSATRRPRRRDAARAASHRPAARCRRPRPSSTAATTASRPAVSSSSRMRRTRRAPRSSMRSGPSGRSWHPSSASTRPALAWRKGAERRGRRTVDRRRPPRRHRAAGATGTRRRDRSHGRRRLLQHASRGGTNAAGAVARVPGRYRRHRPTRSSSSRTAPTTDEKLGAEFVESFGPEFRYVDLGDDARHRHRSARSTAASASGAAGRSRS